jgi:hypothetical protein
MMDRGANSFWAATRLRLQQKPTRTPSQTPPEDLDPIGVWKRFGQGPVLVDLVPCTQAEFDEERFEPDSLPAAAWRRGRCLYERPA